MSHSHPPSPEARDARAIWQAGVDAADARDLVANLVTIEDNQLRIDSQTWSLEQLDRICVVGAGKATAAMASGFMQALRESIPSQQRPHCIGQINVPDGHQVDAREFDVRQVRDTGANLPTRQAVAATGDMLKLLEGLGPRDLCLTLISGGGSALLTLPLASLTLESLIQVTLHLSENGCDIRSLNTVRSCLDEAKAGGLARHCRAGHCLCLVLSDIIGDPLELIASGPMVGGQRDANKALEVLATYDPRRQLPADVYRSLKKTQHQAAAEGSQVPHVVIGNVQTAVAGAVEHARSLGYSVIEEINDESPDVTEDADRLLKLLASGDGNYCVISGGEPTVHLVSSELRGRGGRNQQLVLHALQLWREQFHDRIPKFAFLSGGTDGEDGNTPVAGSWCDLDVDAEASRLELPIGDFLNRNDSFHFFEPLGSLLETGPTNTNVCDLRVFLGRLR
ncbi:MAG: glycerate kinase type-2 family protein [Pirellulaceae bacterium]